MRSVPCYKSQGCIGLIQDLGDTHRRKTRAGVCLLGVSPSLRTLVSLGSPEGLRSGSGEKA